MKSIFLKRIFVTVLTLTSLAGCGEEFNEENVKDIHLNTNDVKVNYEIGESLDLSNLSAIVTYNDETEKEIGIIDGRFKADPFKSFPEVGYTFDVLGKTEIYITFGNARKSFFVYVTLNDSQDLYLEDSSVKYLYNYGEKLDLAGLGVFTYSNGKRVDIHDYTTDPVEGTSLILPGVQRVDVIYSGRKISFYIHVEYLSQNNLRINSSNVKKDYKYGEKLDLSGLEVTCLVNGEEYKIEDYTSKPSNGAIFAEWGERSIEISYAGAVNYFSVHVDRPQPCELIIDESGFKQAYKFGERLQLSGLGVTLRYEDGTKISSKDLMYTSEPSDGAILDTIGEKDVTIKCGGLEQKVTIYTGVEDIYCENSKATYNVNEYFSVSYFKVYLVFVDGSQIQVSNFNTSIKNGTKFSSGGTRTVAVGIGSFKISVSITVINPLTGILLETSKVKKEYSKGDTLDLTNLKVYATYEVGDSKEVKDYVTNPKHGDILDIFGEITIEVTYENMSKDFKIFVDEPYLMNEEI